ncbi:MAG TPA: LLM class F420-dependent oxidoreductase [Nitrospira sp.]
MQFGIFVFETAFSLDTAMLAKHAEDLGFESFWVPEHPIIPVTTSSPYRGSPDGVIPDAYKRIVDPFVALARASAVTKTIKLGTGICLVPEHNPLMLAKTIATLDHFSGGRFMFGIGAGWLQEETEVMGGDFPHRWTQTREAILAMKELWTKDEAEYHGQYYNFPPVLAFPKPVQKPHPPVLLGGTARQVFQRIVEWGDGWMPNRVTTDDIRRGRSILNELAEQVGRDPKSLEVLAFGFSGQFRSRAALQELEEAGANRTTIWLDQTAGDAALTEMEQIAKQVFA